MNVQILTMNGGVSHTLKDKYAVTSPFQIVADTGIVYTMCVTHDTPRLLYKMVFLINVLSIFCGSIEFLTFIKEFLLCGEKKIAVYFIGAQTFMRNHLIQLRSDSLSISCCC